MYVYPHPHPHTHTHTHTHTTPHPSLLSAYAGRYINILLKEVCANYFPEICDSGWLAASQIVILKVLD